MLESALHHPRRLWIRKAIFQVHLWAGVLLTLYLVVIALTGSVLVFESELTGFALPAGITRTQPSNPMPVAEVVAAVQRAYPGAATDLLTVPLPSVPAYRLALRTADGHRHNLLADAATGRLVEAPRTWVQWVHDLHVYLLLNPRYGMQVNAAGAAVLLLLTVTGLLLWWGGLRNWTRGLRVNLRASWRRINYDLHSAIGFWTLLLSFWWALSGMYFGFYRPIARGVDAVFTVRNMHAPAALPASQTAGRVPLATVLRAAQAASPRGRLYSLSNADLHSPTAYASMDLGERGGFLHRDIVCIGTADGRVLSVWHYADKHSAGDWILWLMHPLHFGTEWGLLVKVLWFVLGLSPAVLALTGLMMYWNRCLRHKLHSVT